MPSEPVLICAGRVRCVDALTVTKWSPCVMLTLPWLETTVTSVASAGSQHSPNIALDAIKGRRMCNRMLRSHWMAQGNECALTVTVSLVTSTSITLK